jgi:hypothetical protein
MTYAFEAEGLVKRFVLGVLGPNGAGKTTALRGDHAGAGNSSAHAGDQGLDGLAPVGRGRSAQSASTSASTLTTRPGSAASRVRSVRSRAPPTSTDARSTVTSSWPRIPTRTDLLAHQRIRSL